MLKHYREIVCILMLCGAALSGCSQAPVQLSARDYLAMAKQNKDNNANYYLIQAAQAYINARQMIPALRLLEQIQQSPLSTKDQQLLQLVQAKYQLFQQRNGTAIRLLNGIDASYLSKSAQIEKLSLLAQAYIQQNNWQQSIISLDDKLQLQPQKEQHSTVANIWQTLLALPISTLESAQTDNPGLAAWINLAIQSKSATNSQDLQQRLNTWQQNNPNHPGNLILPEKLAQLDVSAPQLSKITLLLPLSGQFASSGAAIRNGFIAAYYADQQAKPQLSIVDSASGDVEDLYKQAITNGSQLVIGPLIKANVKKIADHDVPVPTIALNNIDSRDIPDNMYQFGLSPRSEARQIADRAWREQHQKALIIMPKNKWGNSVAQAFIKRWQQLGGQVSDISTYSNYKFLKQDIMHALNIDESYARKAQLQQITGAKLRMLPQRRKDIDMIFLISDGNYAHQIKPLLNFYFAGNLDTYATSAVYNDSGRNLSDLNGIIFTDSPWIINQKQLSEQLKSLSSTINSTWPSKNNMQRRLNALGVDAFDLSKNLNRLQYFNAFGLPAASGNLFIGKNNSIVRQLNWAKINKSKVNTLL